MYVCTSTAANREVTAMIDETAATTKSNGQMCMAALVVVLKLKCLEEFEGFSKCAQSMLITPPQTPGGH